jgi:O-methyltransferase involved in polyketide biosynthesis
VDRPPWAPDEVDITAPSVARVYDYLGGSHNFAADRAFAQAVVAVYPAVPAVARQNRGFLRRAVQYLVAEGVDQFLDLGSGIPTVGNVHEVARAANPATRVVYVEHDPVAIMHGRALLADDSRACMVAADFLDPDRVLAQAVTCGGLDLGRPIAVLAVAVLHFVPDERRPAEVLAHYLRPLPPGSHLVISHTRSDCEPAAMAGQRLYAQLRSRYAVRPRSPVEIAALFGDLTLVDPGVVPVPAWRPCPAEACGVPDDHPMLGGLGRRD